jgi:hypothetical protein
LLVRAVPDLNDRPANPILAAAGYNFRLLLHCLAALL